MIDELFLSDDDRQRELESLCDGKFPQFGYGALAQLVANSSCFSTVLTTNFDDLLADALYLYTDERPLVIGHESLAPYIRPGRTRPLIVKVHGDHRLSPKSRDTETARLDELLKQNLQALIHDRGLIFAGYAGRDVGVTEMVSHLPAEVMRGTVYWVNRDLPKDAELADWLVERGAIWVPSTDFDDLMILVHDACGLEHPNAKRFDRVYEEYMETLTTRSEVLLRSSDVSEEGRAVKEAASRVSSSLPTEWQLVAQAIRLEPVDPDGAESVYRDAVSQFPKSARLLGNYANFLTVVRKD
ncbi:MAG: SIR2 family protein, partial [Dehalococcoidia bacterium]